MWQKSIKKTIYLLNINNYDPELTAITYPFIERYAKKIKAGIHIINERKFPEWDMDYEKLQIYELAQKHENDWNIYIDSDALVHPELPDITDLIPFDTVAHNGSDFAPIRWRYDRFFRRDGRHISSCNWLACASSWCIDLWKPLDDMTMAECVENIFPIPRETASKIVTAEHLVSDYAVSRNIAKYGLKFKSLFSLWKDLKMESTEFFHHEYTITIEEKIFNIKLAIKRWGV